MSVDESWGPGGDGGLFIPEGREVVAGVPAEQGEPLTEPGRKKALPFPADNVEPVNEPKLKPPVEEYIDVKEPERFSDDNESDVDRELGDIFKDRHQKLTEMRATGSVRAASRIDQLRKIDAEGAFSTSKNVEGYTVDPNTAHLLVQLYDSLSPENQQKFDKAPFMKLVDLAWSHASFGAKNDSEPQLDDSQPRAGTAVPGVKGISAASDLQVGDSVICTVDDKSSGIVLEIEGDAALVQWSDGVTSLGPLDEIRKASRRTASSSSDSGGEMATEEIPGKAPMSDDPAAAQQAQPQQPMVYYCVKCEMPLYPQQIPFHQEFGHDLETMEQAVAQGLPHSYSFRTAGYRDEGKNEGEQSFIPSDMDQRDLDRIKSGRAGEIASEVLEHHQQMAGTIYYDRSVSPEDLDRWEQGFTEGFTNAAQRWMQGRAASLENTIPEQAAVEVTGFPNEEQAGRAFHEHEKSQIEARTAEIKRTLKIASMRRKAETAFNVGDRVKTTQDLRQRGWDKTVPSGTEGTVTNLEKQSYVFGMFVAYEVQWDNGDKNWVGNAHLLLSKASLQKKAELSNTLKVGDHVLVEQESDVLPAGKFRITSVSEDGMFVLHDLMTGNTLEIDAPDLDDAEARGLLKKGSFQKRAADDINEGDRVTSTVAQRGEGTVTKVDIIRGVSEQATVLWDDGDESSHDTRTLMKVGSLQKQADGVGRIFFDEHGTKMMVVQILEEECFDPSTGRVVPRQTEISVPEEMAMGLIRSQEQVRQDSIAMAQHYPVLSSQSFPEEERRRLFASADDAIVNTSGVVQAAFRKLRGAAFIEAAHIEKTLASDVDEDGKIIHGSVRWRVNLDAPRQNRKVVASVEVPIEDGEPVEPTELVMSTGAHYPLSEEGVTAALGTGDWRFDPFKRKKEPEATRAFLPD